MGSEMCIRDRFLTDLKVGDFVTVPGAGAGGADLTARVNAIASNTSMTLASNSATAVTSVQMIRKRNQLRDQEKNLLLRKLRKDVIKTLKTDGNNAIEVSRDGSAGEAFAIPFSGSSQSLFVINKSLSKKYTVTITSKC
mgnify:CR=1 FL=1